MRRRISAVYAEETCAKELNFLLEEQKGEARMGTRPLHRVFLKVRFVNRITQVIRDQVVRLGSARVSLTLPSSHSILEFSCCHS